MRPQIGDTVRDKEDDKIGIVFADDHSTIPFCIGYPDGKSYWRSENEIEVLTRRGGQRMEPVSVDELRGMRAAWVECPVIDGFIRFPPLDPMAYRLVPAAPAEPADITLELALRVVLQAMDAENERAQQDMATAQKRCDILDETCGNLRALYDAKEVA